MFKICREDGGIITELTVRGHAEYANKGRDIVCAAATTALWMAVSHIERASLAKVKTVDEEGYVNCIISPQREEGADVLLDALVECMRALAAQYPKNLFITEV
ncbi:MAG: ribosomal-processing cysteine protease Prp [Clostridia bacterium]|nr:ribosomal-processing cysteine protease Prp [Clostridia bacterium]